MNERAAPAAPTRGRGILEPTLARLRARQARRLLPSTTATGSLLDIGCGSYPVFLLSTPAARKCGIDQLGGAVAPEGIEFIQRNLHVHPELPFEAGTFDAVTMLAVFEHLEPRALSRVLAEVHRVLKPGGAYVMTTPARWTPLLIDLLAALRMVSRDEIDEHKGAYGSGEIRRLLSEAGFASSKIRVGHFEVFLNNWARAVK